MPKNYQESLNIYDLFKDTLDPNVYNYYKTIFEHELREFDDTFSKWEVNRIY
jgi:glutamine synthetase